ncbi:MAG: hypothetical protein Ta2A_01210 [Treponemataceae bacterium]|nr:MAG: hypothetical protein Ta2A_01210 [Treponemataceae bacterium]
MFIILGDQMAAIGSLFSQGVFLSSMAASLCMALSDIALAVAECFLVDMTFTRKRDKKTTVLVWCAYLAVFLFLDTAAYLASGESGEAAAIADIAIFLLSSVGFVPPAIFLYRESRAACVFFTGMAGLITVLVALILAITVSAINPDLFVIDGTEYFMTFKFTVAMLVCKIPAAFLLVFLYRRYLSSATKAVISALGKKILSFVPFSLGMLLYFYLFGVFLDYYNLPIPTFVRVYALIISTFAVMYWLIYNSVLGTGRNVHTENDLDLARTIQKNCLISVFPAFPEYRKQFDLYARSIPAKEVGGDFYDFFLIDEDHLAIIIADASGKGIPAALFTMIAKTVIRVEGAKELDPCLVLEAANRHLCETNQNGLFVTCFMGVLEISSKKLTFANAGHNPPARKTANGKIEFFDMKKGLVLAAADDTIFEQQQVALCSDDVLFFYTDGITEANNAAREMFGNDRLTELLDKVDMQKLPLPRICDAIENSLADFIKNEPQADDITEMLIRIN